MVVYKPRYYQEDCIVDTISYVTQPENHGKGGLAVLPTASGKSLCIAETVKRLMFLNNTSRFMMLTHAQDLIEQNMEKLKSIWKFAPAGIFSAGLGKKQYTFPITYAGIQSVYKKSHLFGKIDYVLIDEAHTISPKGATMYGRMLRELRDVNPNMIIIGYTATPYRMGTGLLTEGMMFDDIIYDISTMDKFVRLIDEGYLCDLHPYPTSLPFDLKDVKKIAGEFSEASLDENLNRHEITKAVVAEVLIKAHDRKKGMAYCVSISHAENMCKMFVEAGLKATFIHSEISKEERRERMSGFKSGEYNMMVSVGALTTGVDVPDVDYLVIARPTESTSLHVQILGRGMRPHPSKKDCLVLDFAGNTIRLGPVNDPVIPQSSKGGGGKAPIRICESCEFINHAAARFCKGCGIEFPPPKVKIDEVAHVTEMIRRKDVPKISDFEVGNVMYSTFKSPAGTDVVKVTFACGGEYFDLYMTFDEINQRSATMASLQKWKYFKITQVPKTAHEAVELLKSSAKNPKTIKVWLNRPVVGKLKKRPDIISVDH